MSAKKPTMEQWQRAYSLAAEVYAGTMEMDA